MESATSYPTEHELKLDLGSRENYAQLIEALGEPLRVIEQENYFFDTPENMLLQSLWALRIRVSSRTEKDAATSTREAEITLKGPQRGESEMSSRSELNEEISVPLSTAVIAGGMDLSTLHAKPLAELRKITGDRKLLPLVSFTNKRSVFDLRSECECCFEVDLTNFGNGVFGYELEIEFEQPDREAIECAARYVKELFRRLSIPYKIQETSKFALALKNHSLLK